MFIANNLVETAQNLDEDEFVTCERYTVDEIMIKIRSGEIVDNKTISSILMYRDFLDRSH